MGGGYTFLRCGRLRAMYMPAASRAVRWIHRHDAALRRLMLPAGAPSSRAEVEVCMQAGGRRLLR